MSHEARFQALNLTLPPAPRPVAVYRPVVVHGGLAYVSGHGPLLPDKSLITGRVGAELDLKQGKAAARQVGLTMLATLRSHFGSLDRIERVIKLLGMVNSAPDFLEHPQVINGCSELFVEVFGEDAGIGTRSAVGMVSLPGHIAVEIEGTFALRPE
jgi:enamine deaminase RidA (YjgF/YER057c/UK114 family)